MLNKVNVFAPKVLKTRVRMELEKQKFIWHARKVFFAINWINGNNGFSDFALFTMASAKGCSEDFSNDAAISRILSSFLSV